MEVSKPYEKSTRTSGYDGGCLLAVNAGVRKDFKKEEGNGHNSHEEQEAREALEKDEQEKHEEELNSFSAPKQHSADLEFELMVEIIQPRPLRPGFSFWPSPQDAPA
jgi:hypothetical protein